MQPKKAAASEPLEVDVGPQCLLKGFQLLSWDVAIKIGSRFGFLQRINTTLSALLKPALLLPGFVRSNERRQEQQGPV